MFKAIKDKFKRKSAFKFLKKELSQPLTRAERSSGISSVGCLVDLDKFENANLFYDLVEEFGLRPNAIKIIGYKKFYDSNSPYSAPVFSDDDLGWKGNIDNSYVLEFLNKEYDMLVNYYAEENLLLQLVNVKAKARIRVGFKEIDAVNNDLILDVPMDNFKLFKLELKKYLKVLNEIKK